MILFLLVTLSGCQLLQKDKDLLDPEKPITITLWHYYNGHTKDRFDELVTEFNETIGMERGIVIDAMSQGDVAQLAAAVFDSAQARLGAQPMPDVFASYPDNAYRVHQIVPLVELETYMTTEELDAYRQEFLDEGRFIEDNKLRIIPIAKSSENLYINKTLWDEFAMITGARIEDLATWEGVYDIAQRYHEQTGKGFIGVDATANFMILSSLQLSEEIYQYDVSETKLNFTKDVARRIWDYFYRPYLQGYFMKSGRFSSDDAKTGTIIAYTGSTAGAAYFPKEVALDESTSFEIEPLILPFPYFEGGEKVAIQQGAGMCVTKSDAQREYAAMTFLKWFTDIDQNVDFAVSTGYMPVKNEALDKAFILPAIVQSEQNNKSIVASMTTTIEMFDDYKLYNNKPFDGSFEMRTIFETHLMNQIQKDLLAVETLVEKGEDRQSVIATLMSDEAFESWYSQLLSEASKVIEIADK